MKRPKGRPASQVGKNKKKWNSHGVGREVAARGSSWRKPLRRRALHRGRWGLQQQYSNTGRALYCRVHQAQAMEQCRTGWPLTTKSDCVRTDSHPRTDGTKTPRNNYPRKHRAVLALCHRHNPERIRVRERTDQVGVKINFIAQDRYN